MAIDYQRRELNGQLIGYRRVADGADVPLADDNAEYVRLQERIAGGYAPLAADLPPIVYGRTIDVSQRLRTTSATPAEIARWTLAGLTGYRAKLELLAVDAGNGAVKAMEAVIVAKRLAGGALIVGAPAVVVNVFDAAASAWTVSAAASGNDVVITVTGAAGRTIDWALGGRVVSFTPAGES